MRLNTKAVHLCNSFWDQYQKWDCIYFESAWPHLGQHPHTYLQEASQRNTKSVHPYPLQMTRAGWIHRYGQRGREATAEPFHRSQWAGLHATSVTTGLFTWRFSHHLGANLQWHPHFTFLRSSFSIYCLSVFFFAVLRALSKPPLVWLEKSHGNGKWGGEEGLQKSHLKLHWSSRKVFLWEIPRLPHPLQMITLLPTSWTTILYLLHRAQKPALLKGRKRPSCSSEQLLETSQFLKAAVTQKETFKTITFTAVYL